MFNPLERNDYWPQYSYNHLFVTYYQKPCLLRFSSNSEAEASEVLENLEERFPLYYMPNDLRRVNPVSILICVERTNACEKNKKLSKIECYCDRQTLLSLTLTLFTAVMIP